MSAIQEEVGALILTLEIFQDTVSVQCPMAASNAPISKQIQPTSFLLTRTGFNPEWYNHTGQRLPWRVEEIVRTKKCKQDLA